MRDDREKFDAYITKYALSTGIFRVGVELCADISPTMVAVIAGRNSFHGNDWHRTEASAKERAETMRVAKIAALKKQLARLEAMKF